MRNACTKEFCHPLCCLFDDTSKSHTVHAALFVLQVRTLPCYWGQGSAGKQSPVAHPLSPVKAESRRPTRDIGSPHHHIMTHENGVQHCMVVRRTGALKQSAIN